MISLKINEIPKFMSLLFSSESFDSFFVSEVSIETFSTFTIDGYLNKDFLDEDEVYEKYARWSRLRPLCRELIKGKRTPILMKFAFIVPDDKKDAFLSQSDFPGTYGGIHFILNIVFEGNSLRIISATSTDTFMLDKSYEGIWDKAVIKMLNSMNLSYDEL